MNDSDLFIAHLSSNADILLFCQAV